jgi:hypothetical protein
MQRGELHLDENDPDLMSSSNSSSNLFCAKPMQHQTVGATDVVRVSRKAREAECNAADWDKMS